MTIGERIKALRKKNDLTQEKLADYLGVSYQAVSKWECGASCPDLALIGPLTRLLHVTADELLGLTPPCTDERKAYFDAEYHEFWKKDCEADLEIARQAVAEYPGDFRYLYWLATTEWFVGHGVEMDRDLLESSARHNLFILENCVDPYLRNGAISGLVYAYMSLDDPNEAKKYAMMYPEDTETSRDKLLSLCLKGDELDKLQKGILYKSLLRLLCALDAFRYAERNLSVAAMDAEEAILRAIIPDGNYQHFHAHLGLLNLERAKVAARDGRYDEAAELLTDAKEHVEQFDRVYRNCVEVYTAPLLDGYTAVHDDRRFEEETMKDYVCETALTAPVFAPLREREDFQALFGQ